ncbi:MAG: NADH-quinone oxidoreductase subunit C [Dehalococcoidia bacterium]|nr:NADH-quinone oxidoreductase subunit C [Dehalococcoidia bacterium]
MTKPLCGEDVARQIGEHLPDVVTEFDESAVFVPSKALFEVARFLKESLEFDYLTSISAVDYFEHFELVYHLTSIKYNHSVVIKTRCDKGEKGEKSVKLPSVVSLWRGADFQEREIYDLMGIAFEGHPNLKRLFLWEGFQGHPLRKDFRTFRTGLSSHLDKK